MADQELTNDFIRDTFRELISDFGILYEPDMEEEWDSVVGVSGFTPVDYVRINLQYQYTYMECFTDQMVDLSVIFKTHSGDTVGVWPLTLKKEEGVYSFCTNAQEVLPPVFMAKVSEKNKKKYDTESIEAMEKLYAIIKEKGENISPEWQSRYLLLDQFASNEDVLWYRKCMEAGAKTYVETELYTDVTMSMDELRSAIRRSHKKLIKKGQSLWHIEHFDHVSDELWEEFHQKHIETAGRVTRSDESWEVQKNMINAGKGFYSVARDDDGKFVGASFYEFFGKYCRTAVSVHDRSLFDQPIGHLVKWGGIEHMKELGVELYYLGERYYPAGGYTDKEMAISWYKEGFATDFVIRVMLNNTIKEA